MMTGVGGFHNIQLKIAFKGYIMVALKKRHIPAILILIYE